MTAPAASSDTSRARALACGIAAHCIWGILPLYLILVKDVPAVEFVAWRTLFTLPICLFCIVLTGKRADLAAIIRQPRVLRVLTVSAALIALNWLGYIWAIQNEHVYAASLGYYILPLVMMLLGVIFLGEPLSTRQWLAVTLAGAGVTALAAGALTTLWVSLLLAFSFGFYGLIRKTVNAGPLTGLTIESAILLPVVLGYLGWVHFHDGGTAFGRAPLETAAIIGAGFVTAVPLILFATAARGLPYTLVGFLQFLAPSIMFVLGLTVFGEDLNTAQLLSFMAIWSAAGLFSWDLFRKGRKQAQPA